MATPGSLFLGLDIGTQSTKALVIDVDSHRVVARASVAYGLIEGLPPGHAEQHPETWIDAVRKAAHEALRTVDAAQVAGVGVSGQQHGCVVLDERDQVIRPAKLWCDTSTAAEAAELSRAIGRAVPTGFTASKLTWLQRHEPQHWARVRSVLLPHDYINFRLTGTKTMECGDASGSGVFDAAQRAFDPRAVSAVHPTLARMLPPVLGAGELAGVLSAEGAALLGLRAGVPVAAGGGDNMMSAIGSGATKSGVVVVSLGTSGTVFTRTEHPVVDPQGLIAPFCSSDGAWLPLLCVMNLTGVTEEVKALTGLSHGELTALAERVAPGCDGLTWLPYLQGERVPDLPTATGTMLGMRPGLLRPGHLYRAALECTSMNLAWGVGRMRALGVQLGEVRLTGGAAKNALWRQILADVLHVPIVPLVEAESAALGAAIQAVWSMRRSAGENVSCDAIAAPFVQLGPATKPDPVRAPHMAMRLQAFVAAVQQLHPGA
jgi:xylulokinase